ncbi:MAG TPA: hypothetical protein DCX17_00950 [Firmicutes bacterium]|jgi:thiol-disulfide isomerase/thioredoxin|nr:hypothetical protein [Bacillota bacterium]
MKKIVFISAIWCPACLIMRPRYQTFCSNKNSFVLQELDFDDDASLIKQLNIGKTLPVAIVYDGSKELKRLSGEMSLKKIEEQLRAL